MTEEEKTTQQKVKCQSCGKEFDELPLHTCPFKEELHDAYETLCNCCPYCTRECAMNV